jgi:alkylhydroperoxidase family enzyme
LRWLATRDDSPTADGLEHVLGLCPELLERSRAFYGALWDEGVLPARLLELCRLRIASQNGCQAESLITHSESGLTVAERSSLARGDIPTSVSDVERRVLDVASKVPFEIHDLEDDEIEALRRELGDDGLVALMVALPLFDASCRLRLVLEVPPEAREVDRPASRTGKLY